MVINYYCFAANKLLKTGSTLATPWSHSIITLYWKSIMQEKWHGLKKKTKKERHLNDFQSNNKTRSNEWIILLANTGKKVKMKTNVRSLVKPA